jgi:hypothetical protein
VDDVAAGEPCQRLVGEGRSADVTFDLGTEPNDRVGGGRIGRIVAD